MAQQSCQRHKVDARLCRPSRPSVAKIVQPEGSHLATPHRAVVGIVHLAQGSGLVRFAREEEDFATVDGLGSRDIEEQKRRNPSCSIRLWSLPHDRFHPIYDRSLHCDPMIRKRVIRVHVNFGNTCIATLTQPVREFLIIRGVAIVSFQH